MARLLALMMTLLLGACAAPAQSKGSALLLDHVTVIDGRGGPPVADQAVLIQDGRIAAIGRGGSISAPQGANRLDLTGRFLVPGLIDSHVHLKTRSRDRGMIEQILANVLLRSGVTTVRDMGGNGAELVPLARAAESGAAVSPHILLSSLFTGSASDFWLGGDQAAFISGVSAPGSRPWFHHITDARQIDDAVGEARAWGAHGIKAHSGFTAKELALVGQTATRNGLRLWSHAAPAPARPSAAVAAGATAISHADMLAYEGAAEARGELSGYSYRVRVRLAMASTPIGGEALSRLFRLMRQRGTCLEPTLFVMQQPREPDPAMQTYLAYVYAVTARAHREGVAICAGTDAIGGGSSNLPQELALLVERTGLTPLEAITAATVNNAHALGLSDRGTSRAAGSRISSSSRATPAATSTTLRVSKA